MVVARPHRIARPASFRGVNTPRLSSIALVVVALWGGCSDAGLQAIVEEVETADDELRLDGQFCTSAPDEVTFPVKVLVVVDQSASLQCTDPGNARLAALDAAGARLDPFPNVQFASVGFASWSRTVDFTTDWAKVSEALAPSNGQGGPATDYQGGLASALRLLEQDMLRSGPAENARSKYVVLFLSDGVPEPRCTAGCDDGDVQPDSLYGVCNTTQTIAEEDYVDMQTACPEYNSEAQIREKVQAITELGGRHGVGSLTFNTILLFAPPEEIEAVCGDVAAFGYIREEAEPLLVSMATEGEGTYRDINTAEEIDFIDFGYASLFAPFRLVELFAINATAMPTERGIQPDSDGDGLDDGFEFDQRMDRMLADGDGDGFGDQLELVFGDRGLDPLDAEVPAWGCADAEDRDGDGLSACEEAFLGTNVLLADSDGDRFPDGLELRFGLDPLEPDTRVDHDLDGRFSGDEIRAGTHPWIFDEDLEQLDVVNQGVVQGDPRDDDTRCYDFTFSGITLVTPLDSEVSKGRNRIYVYAHEEPEGLAGRRGRTRIACAEARYLGSAFKAPVSGRIEGFSAARFVDLPVFDPELHCLGIDEDPASTPAWAVGE